MQSEELLRAFSDDISTRLAATASIGREIDGDTKTRVNPDTLRHGWSSLRPLLSPLHQRRVEAATAQDGNSYGAWNPLALFVGHSLGTGAPRASPAEEHHIGYPQFWRDGRFKRSVQNICYVAFRGGTRAVRRSTR